MTLASLSFTLHVISFSGYTVFPPVVFLLLGGWGLSIKFFVA